MRIQFGNIEELGDLILCRGVRQLGLKFDFT